jgi:hypothetical protein
MHGFAPTRPGSRSHWQIYGSPVVQGERGPGKHGIATVRRALRFACTVLSAGILPGAPASAYMITITAGARSLYLQVGVGTYTGGNYSAGGQPANNATVNMVSVTVPAASVGNGTAQAMTSNSTTANSFIDGYAFCNPPAEVYVGGWSRPGSGSGTATLSVTTPASLTSGANSIPFSQISWVSSGNGDTTTVIPSGTFVGGTQTLTTIAANSWKEECFAFSYANTVTPAAGTYTGRAVYTLSLP